jgi:hypothetical protein
MRIWSALILTPALALACQSVLFALVTPSCASQTRLALHGTALAALILAAVLTAMAWQEWTRLTDRNGVASESDAAETEKTRGFLAAVALAVSALSLLLIVTLWGAVWILSPCSTP